MSKRERPTAVGIFSYAGGFTYGVSKHFDVEAVFDAPLKHIATARHNLPDIPHYTAPVEEALDTWPIDCHCGIDLVYGNPPCAPWSNNNKSGRHYTEDPRFLGDHLAIREAAFRMDPAFYTFESVIQMSTKGRHYIDRLSRQWNDRGYHTTEILLNAKHLGTAQSRKSFFFIAHRWRIPWEEAIFFEPMTALQALTLLGNPDDEPDNSTIEGKFLDGRIHLLRPGEKWRELYDRLREDPESDFNPAKNERGQWRGRPSWGCVRLHPDRVTPKVVGYEWVHPVEDRLMTAQEIAYINTFPRDWEFVNGPRHARTEIAQGVMPAVAAWLARLFRLAIEEGEPAQIGRTKIDARKGEIVYKERRRVQLGLFEQAKSEVEVGPPVTVAEAEDEAEVGPLGEVGPFGEVF